MLNGPKLPENLLQKLKQSDKQPPWRCKIHFTNGRTLYGVEVSADGAILRINDRSIHSEAELGFPPASIIDVTVS